MTGGLTAAEIRWPAVPACYGWLSLDRRGTWRLKGEPVRHRGMIAFINDNYGPQGDGSWVFRNGPQRVYVTLEYMPFVMRLGSDDAIALHTGVVAGRVDGGWVDEEGNVLLRTAAGAGSLDDRDLGRFLSECVSPSGEPASEADVLGVMTGQSQLRWRGLSMQAIRRDSVPSVFGFSPEPHP